MNLKEYLKSRKFTYEEFSKMVGISRQSITNYINFRRRPSLWVALRIQEATNGKVTVEDLNHYWEAKKKYG